MYFYLKVFSKNKKSLHEFLIFLSKIKSPIIIFCNFPQKKTKTFFTLLKSPHVNKTAQEQFEYKIFSKTLSVWSPQYKLLLILLKKTIKTSFPGIQIQLTCLVSSKYEKKSLVNSLNPKIINSFFFQTPQMQRLRKKKIFKYINLFDCFGEIMLNHT